MGFDLFIEAHLTFSTATGKPFFYDEITIPEKLRSYAQLRGKFLHAYTEVFNYEERYEVDVYGFLEQYPKWSDIMENEHYKDYCKDYWYETDHDQFRELLTWCKESKVEFYVTWSY